MAPQCRRRSLCCTQSRQRAPSSAWLAVLVGLMWCSSVTSQSPPPPNSSYTNVDVELLKLIVHAPSVVPLEFREQYQARLPDASFRQLIFPASAPPSPEWLSGTRLTLKVKRDALLAPPPPTAGNRKLQQSLGESPDATLSDFEVISAEVPSDGKGAISVTAPLRFTSITYILNMCNWKNQMTIPKLKSSWTNDNLPSGANVDSAKTLQNYFTSCSLNKITFEPAKNLIIGPIDVPCTGRMRGTGAVFDSTKCGNNELYGWQEFAENYTRLNYPNIVLSQFQRRVLVLPGQNGNCGWAGLGSVGCGSTCYAWIRGDYADSLETSFHELGHTLGLLHSSTPGVEYGDGSCVMGGCCGARCFNAPQMFHLGISNPVTVLKSNQLAVGQMLTFDLPATLLNDKNHIQIQPDWSTKVVKSGGMAMPAYYVSFRAPLGFDKYLQNQHVNKVMVHIYNGTQYTGFVKPELQATLTPGATSVSLYDTKDNLDIKLKIKVVSTSNGSAKVTVCRYKSYFETDCNDGIDDDCNGLVDALDPACQAQDVSKCKPTGGCLRDQGMNPRQCPGNCPAVCGDFYCDITRGENRGTCPIDCPNAPIGSCGDGVCTPANGEDGDSCPLDCFCGDGVCVGPDNNESCPLDCPPVCGDKFCSPGTEDFSNCPGDCPAPSPSPPPPRSPPPAKSPPPKKPPPPPPKVSSPPPRPPPPPPSSPSPPPPRSPPPPPQSPPPPPPRSPPPPPPPPPQSPPPPPPPSPPPPPPPSPPPPPPPSPPPPPPPSPPPPPPPSPPPPPPPSPPPPPPPSPPPPPPPPPPLLSPPPPPPPSPSPPPPTETASPPSPQVAGLPPVTSGMTACYFAENFSQDDRVWRDVSSAQAHIPASSFKGTFYVSTEFLNSKTFKAIVGSTTSTFRFPASINTTSTTSSAAPTPYTLFHIARHSSSGFLQTNRGRIIDAVQPNNWFSGHHGGKSGVAFHAQWITPQFDWHSLSWVLSTDAQSLYRAQGVTRSNAPDKSGSKFTQLAINSGLGSIEYGQMSDFKFAALIFYNRRLTDAEIGEMEAFLSSKYGIALVSR